MTLLRRRPHRARARPEAEPWDPLAVRAEVAAALDEMISGANRVGAATSTLVTFPGDDVAVMERVDNMGRDAPRLRTPSRPVDLQPTGCLRRHAGVRVRDSIQGVDRCSTVNRAGSPPAASRSGAVALGGRGPTPPVPRRPAPADLPKEWKDAKHS